MDCRTNNPASGRYTRRMIVAMVFYMVFLTAAVYTFARFHPTGPLAWLLAASPALPIVAALVVVGLYIKEEKDEFLRGIFVQALVWAMGGTLTVTSVWGFLELFLHVRHFDLYLTFPLFWILVGIAGAVLQWRHK